MNSDDNAWEDLDNQDPFLLEELADESEHPGDEEDDVIESSGTEDFAGLVSAIKWKFEMIEPSSPLPNIALEFPLIFGASLDCPR